MSVSVATGQAQVEGFFYENDSALALTIATAHATLGRIDTVVVRLDRTANSATLVVVTGTAAASPVAPTLSATDSLYELPLANVQVDPAVGVITAGKVTDRRVLVKNLTEAAASAAYAAKADYPGTAWAAYTPVLGGSGWDIGNGSISGRWTRAGKIVSFVVEIAFGSTSTFGAGQPTVTPPVACMAGYFYTDGLYYDASAGASWRAYCEVAGSVIYWKTNANPTAAVSSTVPFTWANGDIVRLNGTYEG